MAHDPIERLKSYLSNIDADGREACIQTLVAFGRFAREYDLQPAWERLYELAQRLDDLDDGRVDPLLKPVKPGRGSVPDSQETWRKRQLVLAALRNLELSGMQETDGARLIADEYPEAQTLLTRGRDVAGTILSWKRDFYTDSKAESPHLYELGQQLFNEMYPEIETMPLTFDERKAGAFKLLDKLFGRVTP